MHLVPVLCCGIDRCRSGSLPFQILESLMRCLHCNGANVVAGLDVGDDLFLRLAFFLRALFFQLLGVSASLLLFVEGSLHTLEQLRCESFQRLLAWEVRVAACGGKAVIVIVSVVVEDALLEFDCLLADERHCLGSIFEVRHELLLRCQHDLVDLFGALAFDFLESEDGVAVEVGIVCHSVEAR